MLLSARLAIAASVATLSLGLILAPAAYATDEMKKGDAMKTESMKKDSMSHDSMKKDSMGKDSMAKDSMKKGSMKKDGDAMKK